MTGNMATTPASREFRRRVYPEPSLNFTFNSSVGDDSLIASVDIDFGVARDLPSGKSLADVLRSLFDNNVSAAVRSMNPDSLVA